MSDPTAPLADTPNPAGPGADTTDWRTRYESLQPEYTRTTQALKDEQSVWEDEQAALGRLAEKFPHLFETEDEDTDLPEEGDEDDPVAPLNSRLDKFEQWQQQVENERGNARFKNDLQAELGDETLPKKANDWIKDRTAALGNNPKALKQAVEEYREIVGEIRGPSRKPTPTPPQPGKAAEQDYNASKDPNARRTARRARIAAQVEAGMQEQ